MLESMELAGEVDPTFDYSTLPCTPNLGDFQTVLDFTVSDYGAVVPNGFGVYVPGEGWKTTTHGAQTRTLEIDINFQNAPTMTYLQAIASNVYHGNPTGGSPPHFGVVASTLLAVYTQDEGDLIIREWSGSHVTSTIRVTLLYMNNQIDTYLRRLSLNGDAEFIPPSS